MDFSGSGGVFNLARHRGQHNQRKDIHSLAHDLHQAVRQGASPSELAQIMNSHEASILQSPYAPPGTGPSPAILAAAGNPVAAQMALQAQLASFQQAALGTAVGSANSALGPQFAPNGTRDTYLGPSAEQQIVAGATGDFTMVNLNPMWAEDLTLQVDAGTDVAVVTQIVINGQPIRTAVGRIAGVLFDKQSTLRNLLKGYFLSAQAQVVVSVKNISTAAINAIPTITGKSFL